MPKLNDLLAEAKATDKAYKTARSACLAVTGSRSSDLTKRLYRENQDAWDSLRAAIDDNLPIKFTTSEGRSGTIAVTAAMDSDRCLYYSSNPGATVCVRGIVLHSVVDLEKN